MPSIEIVSVGQKEPSRLPALPFVVKSDCQLESHRAPSLFQQDFDKLSGCMYHLGPPQEHYHGEGYAFFAYRLLSEKSQDSEIGLLEFGKAFRGPMEQLLETAFQGSPRKALVFTSDWQFGPASVSRGSFENLRAFWAAYDAGQLRINALYTIGVKGGESGR